MNVKPTDVLLNGRYRIIKTLSGGMGIVHLCEDTLNDNFPVAVKTIKSEYLSDWDARERFFRDIAVWIDLDFHPNIVQAYRSDYRFESHEIFLSLQLIPVPLGKPDPSLRTWLDFHSSLKQSETLRLGLDIVRGIKHATNKFPNLVHRDLKPANILINSRLSAMVTDFGLVRVSDLKKNSYGTGESSSLVGTPLYMSPEQWLELSCGCYTDIYSFGCILFECICGELCVNGETLEEITNHHISGMAVEKAYGLNISTSLKDLLIRCLHPNPRERFQEWISICVY